MVSIKARGSIRAVSRKVYSFWLSKIVAQTRWFAAITVILILATAANAQSNNLFSSANTSTPHAKVVIVQDPNATDAFQPRENHIRTMVERGITTLTGKPTASAAWLSLVSTQDTVGIKVFSEPGPNSGTRPAVVAAVIQQLLAAGLPPKQIIIWDKHQTDLRLAGYFDLAKRFGVRVAGSAEVRLRRKSLLREPAPRKSRLGRSRIRQERRRPRPKILRLKTRHQRHDQNHQHHPPHE